MIGVTRRDKKPLCGRVSTSDLLRSARQCASKKRAVPAAGLKNQTLMTTRLNCIAAIALTSFLVTSQAYSQAILKPKPKALSIMTNKLIDPYLSIGDAPSAPSINGARIVAVKTDAPFIWTVPATGEKPLKYTAAHLPEGLSIDHATGIITGIAKKNGVYEAKISVSNAKSSAEAIVSFVVGEKLAATPPMGWNSYDCYGDDVTEAEFIANAEYFKKHLAPYGWDTVIVDFRWYDPDTHLAPNQRQWVDNIPFPIDQYGRLVPSSKKFPSAADGIGFKALGDKIHAMGLKFGIHIMRGIPKNAVAENLPIEGSTYTTKDAADLSSTCGWCKDMYGVHGDTPAGRAYYKSIFRLYASWGVDFIKMDDTSRPYAKAEIEAVHDAIKASGRGIVYSLSPGETPVAEWKHVAEHANMWRVSDDFWDRSDLLAKSFDYADRWRTVSGFGSWPDEDMLVIGHVSVGGRSVGPDRLTKFTKPEQITMLTLWSIVGSPLMAGCDLPDLDPWTLALLTNPETLAVDQDASGHKALPIERLPGFEIWVKKLADGSVALALFNRTGVNQDVTVDASQLPLEGIGATKTRKVEYRDLWLRKNVGVLGSGFTATIPAHGAKLYKLFVTK
jgi:hypothetical protein